MSTHEHESMRLSGSPTRNSPRKHGGGTTSLDSGMLASLPCRSAGSSTPGLSAPRSGYGDQDDHPHFGRRWESQLLLTFTRAASNTSDCPSVPALLPASDGRTANISRLLSSPHRKARSRPLHVEPPPESGAVHGRSLDVINHASAFIVEGGSTLDAGWLRMGPPSRALSAQTWRPMTFSRGMTPAGCRR